MIGGEQRLIKNINLNTFIFVWFPSEEIIKQFSSNMSSPQPPAPDLLSGLPLPPPLPAPQEEEEEEVEVEEEE